MPLIVVGISHKTAPVELREKLAFSSEGLEKVLEGFRDRSPLSEMTLLSTCNRTEIYGHSKQNARDWCVEFLHERFGRNDLGNFLYVKEERDMVNHLFKVSAGLDSLVFGENEILKQVKDSYHLCKDRGFTGKMFNVLFQRALYIGKLVRTHTGIGTGALSVGSVAVSLSEKIFGELSQSTVLIFGAGKMAEVSARYLLSKKVRRLLVANRSLDHARALAEKFNAVPLSLEEGLARIVSADIVITSMASQRPILSRELISETMARRQNKSLFLVDIAVPRNVDPQVHQIDNVYLYNIDDLEAIAGENLKNRSKEIEKASLIVDQKSAEFFEWVESLKSGEEKSLKHRPDFAQNTVH